MNIHQNAKLTPQSRADVVRRVRDEGQTPKAVAATVGVAPATVSRVLRRQGLSRLGIRVRRLLTDNGGCYRSRVFHARCAQRRLRHRYTRPFTPRTNGKAERFIQTVLREWAYAHAYHTSAQRAEHLPRWLHCYHWHRPHASLKAKTPISRLGLTGINLLRHHI